MRRRRYIAALAAAAGLAVSQLGPASAASGTASTTTTRQAASTASGAAAAPDPARLADPAEMLPNGWQKSSDEAVTVSGDATGLHVLAASESSGYDWKTVASLGDPAVQTDLWIGQACVTGSGNDAVVVYAPEQVTNEASAQGVLGRAAVVNLRTGAVKDLGSGYSIAYFNPGCGTGDTAVLTSGGWAADSTRTPMSTSLEMVDAGSGTITSTVHVPGQVSSAIPYQGQIAAAGGTGLEEIGSSGKTHALAATTAMPYELTPDASGGLGYQTVVGDKVDLWHLAAGRTKQVASVAKGSVELRQTGGRVWLVGPGASKVHGLPTQWQPVDAPTTAQPSTTGALVVTNAGSLSPAKGAKAQPGTVEPVGVNVQLLGGSRQSAAFQVPTTAAPAVSTQTSTQTKRPQVAPPSAPLSSTPVSSDRTCAIALNDPDIQAYQPTYEQVEWAVDQASQGALTTARPAGVYGSSLPSYTPQGSGGLFPPTLAGVNIPPQVLLGVLTQESNLLQASTHVVQGQTANPLASFNWYGNWIDDDSVDTGLINWSASDCGYGIGQITTGMCLAQGRNDNPQCTDPSDLSAEQQLAVAVDYQANIAASAQMLDNDWTQPTEDDIDLSITYDTQYAPPGEDTQFVDDWYDVLWDYNDGIEPGTAALGNTTGCTPGPSCTDGNGDWGLGYADNPMNSAYPPDRPTFETSSESNYPAPGGATYSNNWDLSHPQYWPYQEKALAFAFDSVVLYDYSQAKWVQAFAFAHGNYTSPPPDLWCTSADNCDASGINETVATGPDACQLTGAYADHCWWHGTTMSWFVQSPSASCSDCGYGAVTYAAGTPEPAAEPIAAQFAQTCASTLPSDAVIVGEGGKSALGCPGTNWSTQGSFSWNFAPDANGNYSSKIDFDQIGAGFGGHFWFGYTKPDDGTSTSSPVVDSEDADRVITGTWSPPSTVTGWTDIQVAIPSYGADATAADYQVNPGGGASGRDVTVNQAATAGTNAWVDLGDFLMGSGGQVTLSNVVDSASAIGVNIAWSSVAFIPAPAPQAQYIAMGDSYASGVTANSADYDPGTADGCERSQAAYGRQFATNDSSIGDGGIQHIACSGATVANLTTTGQNGEPAQISAMDAGAKLVTVTIGGNDIGFAAVLTECLTDPTDCEADYNSDDGSNLYTIMDNQLLPELTSAYKAIQAQAPSAQVVAVTYPEIFQPATTCPGILNLPVPDVQFLISVNLYLDNTILAAAKAAGINALDERYAFLGHQLCSDDPWVYDLPTGTSPGTSVYDSSSWFHPTAEGLGQMASDLGGYWPELQQSGHPTVWPVPLASVPGVGWLPANLPDGIPTNDQATTMLGSIPVVATQPTSTAAGYSAAAFGTWPGVRNGWTTRNRVLVAQALTTAQGAPADVSVGSGNSVYGGTWQLPYDSDPTNSTAPVTFTSTTAPANNVPIDHFVPRANAWISGADSWPSLYNTGIVVSAESTTQGQQMLYDFSNDLSGLELLAVSESTNSSKGDSPPQNWLPPNEGMYCAYAKMWITVKWQWNLTIVPAEQSELAYLVANYC